jgi:hypothetical protein
VQVIKETGQRAHHYRHSICTVSGSNTRAPRPGRMTMTADQRVPGYLGRVLDADGAAVGTRFQVTPGVLITAWHVLSDLNVGDEGATVAVDALDGASMSAPADVTPASLEMNSMIRRESGCRSLRHGTRPTARAGDPPLTTAQGQNGGMSALGSGSGGGSGSGSGGRSSQISVSSQPSSRGIVSG